jgi:hypothetical protein
MALDKETYTKEEVEEILKTQRGNCYVQIYNKTLDKELSMLCVKSPAPPPFKNITWQK